MSVELATQRHFSLYVWIVLLLVTTAATPLWAGGTGGAPCVRAESLALDTTLRRGRLTLNQPDRFQLSIEEAGILMLTVSSAAPEPPQPKLSFLGTSCAREARPGAEYLVLREAPGELVLKLEVPGTYELAVASEDPAVQLSGYKLRTTFVPDLQVPDEVLPLDADPPETCTASEMPSFVPETQARSRFLVLQREAQLAKDVDPWECDIIEGLIETPGVLVVEAQGTPLGSTLYTGSDCRPEHGLAQGTLGPQGGVMAAAVHAGEHRLVLEPLDFSPVHYTLSVKHFAMCDRGEQDDHGDTPLCATPLHPASGVSGTIDNAFGDDEDYFTFTLAAQETVRIEIREGGEAYGLLYDAKGHRLLAGNACQGMDGQGIDTRRLVKTLGPGRYYVRVAGSGNSSQPYGVSFAVLTTP